MKIDCFFDLKTYIKRLEKGGVKFERVKRTPKGIDLKDSQAVDHAIKEDIDESLLQKSPYVAVFMTCDQGYIDILKKWKAAKFETVLIYMMGAFTS
ncbi:hypothetical protein F2Q70_00041932 [Brassica cretica]|uniref:Uncharacterized protein n=1 Tax=Brassica cretica TaxID=69181 RepID=A0A8S9K5Q5_BRACR|nr:hypothetical protein F2Q70_00041932 [Brassica cretica]